MATFARTGVLLCALTLHFVTGAPLRPLTAEETVREYLDNGGHEKIRRALNLSDGVMYDPFASLSRDSVPSGQGLRSGMTLSDIDVMRKMGHFVPGHDHESLLVRMRQRLLTLSREESETVRGVKSVFTVYYTGDPPSSARRAFIFALKKWADTFPCKVPLRVVFGWVNMRDRRTLAAVNSPFSIVGSLSTLRYDTAYTPTLAAAISGKDSLASHVPHFSILFNRLQYWHTDPETPTYGHKYDLATVALHEQCHGLFFSGALQRKTNSLNRGEFRSESDLPSRFDHFMTTSEGRGIAKSCSERKLFQAITTPGLKIRTIVGGSSFRLHAPRIYQPGSSTYHFSARQIGRDCEIFNISKAECSDLMTFELRSGYQQLSIGEPALRVMKSILSQNSGVKEEGECIVSPPTSITPTPAAEMPAAGTPTPDAPTSADNTPTPAAETPAPGTPTPAAPMSADNTPTPAAASPTPVDGIVPQTVTPTTTMGTDLFDTGSAFPSVIPEASPSAAPECFPASATVELVDGTTKRMVAVRLGDRVRVGANAFSDVFMFTHRLSDAKHSFVTLTVSSGAKIALTAGHYLYVNGVLAAAGDVRLGDSVELADGERATVAKVEMKMGEGLYNPQTAHGDIVVDGVRASTYTTAVMPGVAHALLAPLRSVYKRMGLSSRYFDAGAARLAGLVNGVLSN